MKQLPKHFEGKGQVRGYTFNQISATPYGYIYAVKAKGRIMHYEVFKHRENALYKVVSYPTYKSFGKWAWSTASLSRAESILKTIRRKAGKKNQDKLKTQRIVKLYQGSN